MKRFTQEEFEIFDMIYPNRTNEEIAKIFEISIYSVKQKASKRDLKKSEEFISKINRQNELKKEKNPLFQINNEEENFQYREMKSFANKIGYKTPGIAISELSEGGKYNGATRFKKRFNEFKEAV